MIRIKKKKIALLTLASLLVIVLLVAGIVILKGRNNASEGIVPTGQVLTPNIIPRPVEFTENSGYFKLTRKTFIYVNGNSDSETEEIKRIGTYLADILMPSTGYPFKVIPSSAPKKGSIYLTTKNSDPSLGSEGYKLEVTTDKITLSAYTTEGLFRGIQTIRQMLPAEIEKAEVVKDIPWVMACVNIKDYPSYSWRGMMLDVARHFFSVEDVKRTIDLMAQYKMNRFHMHLTDDQGWRIEIKSWPDLTKIGGSTEVGTGDGGFYTQEEYTDIVNYAKERYIMVIPEIDMPGHSNAALASYGELNPDGKRVKPYTKINVGFSSFMCREEITYTFISDVIRELAAITPGEYIHVGGDEAAQTPPEDYDYFIGRINEIVLNNGKKPIGWNPFDTSSGTTSEAYLQYWNSEITAALDKNMKMIISPPGKAYLDMKYNMSFKLGLNWAGYIPTDFAYQWDPTNYAPKESILGIECALWSETIDTMDELETLAFPRLPGHAEIGWTPKELRSWEEYRQRLIPHAKRMECQGIDYYRDPNVDW